MPARRFFAMLNASRVLQATEMLDALDLAAVPLCSAKWYDQIREKWSQRLESASGRGPTAEMIEAQRRAAEGRSGSGNVVDDLKAKLALFKRLRGYGG